MLAQLREDQDVEVCWTDSDGERDWWDARITKTRRTRQGNKQPGVQVAFLDKRRQIDKDSKQKFILVSKLLDSLRIPEVSASAAGGEDHHHDGSPAAHTTSSSVETSTPDEGRVTTSKVLCTDIHACQLNSVCLTWNVRMTIILCLVRGRTKEQGKVPGGTRRQC